MAELLPMLSPIILPARETRRRPVREIDFGAALEPLVRCAVANCAPVLCVPRLPQPIERFGGKLKEAALSSSARRRLQILDRRDTVWQTVRAYFAEAECELKPQDTSLVDVAWALYLVLLAARKGAQLYLNPSNWVSRLDATMASYKVGNETALRLSVARGLFAMFNESTSVPGLSTIARSEVSFRERAEEIMEDAYLAEASALRRFFSANANKAAVRRDLRLLLKTIVRTRKWARGIVTVVDQAAALPPVAKVADALAPLAETGGSQPILALNEGRPAWMPLFHLKDNHYAWGYFQRAFNEDAGQVNTTEVRFVDFRSEPPPPNSR